MSKRELVLIRHAKSSWSHPGTRDIDRPLNSRGKHDAPLIGSFLAKTIGPPDIILSSPSKRTRMTVKRIRKQMDLEKDTVVFHDHLYLADIGDFISIIQGLDDSYKKVFICSHNPGTTDFANYLCGSGIENVPTCGFVHCALKLHSWKDIDRGSGHLITFDYPKNHYFD